MNVTNMTGSSFQHSLLTMIVLLFCLGYQGCGSVGPPVPPEEVGIRATVLEQQSQRVDPTQNAEKEPELVPLEGEPPLPPLRPIGTR